MPIPYKDLLDLDDQEFINAAYQRFLSRPADDQGLNHYRRRLLLGVSKLRILYDISCSPEAAERLHEHKRIQEELKFASRKPNPLTHILRRAFGHRSNQEDAEFRFRMRLLTSIETLGSGERIFNSSFDNRKDVATHSERLSDVSSTHSSISDKLFSTANSIEFSDAYGARAKKVDPISIRYCKTLRTVHDRLSILPQVRRASSESVKFSILVPVFRPPLALLAAAIKSVQNQSYFNWELCLVDDGSGDSRLSEFLLEMQAQDSRIRLHVLPKNMGIAAASNAALALASGEFIGLLDNDDVLTLDALDHVAARLEKEPDLELIYSDEVKIDVHGFPIELFPKPDWSPSSLFNCMYTGHFSVYRRQKIIDLGGFRSDFDYSQDYDLALRATEGLSRVGHIPVELYGWRMIEGSAAQGDKPHARKSNIAALQSAIDRRGLEARVLACPLANYARIEDPHPSWKLTIIVPSDNPKNIIATIESIQNKSSRVDFEIIVVTNSGIIADISRLSCCAGVIFAKYDKPFNFSDKCNVGATMATGDLLIFFNDDVRVVSEDWMERILEAFWHDKIGVVGPKLLYENYTIQHAGMIAGCRGLVGTAFHCLPHETTEHFGAALWMREVSLICGALLAIRRNLFESISGFDAINAPIGHSDVDLCFRVREEGYSCVYTPYATLIHIGHMSIAEDEAIQRREKKVKKKDKSDIFLLRRWAPEVAYDPYFPPKMRDILYHDSPEQWNLYPSSSRFPSTGGSDILIISHDLSSSGAPRVVFEIAKNLVDIGHFVTVMSPVDGSFRKLLTDAGITVIVDELVLREHDSLQRFATNFDFVICNTVVTWPAVIQLSPHVPVFWYIHEMSLLTHLLGIHPRIVDAINACTGLWAGSGHAAKILQPFRDSVKVLEYGVSEAHVASQIRADRTPLVVSVFGSFEPRKGQDLAILAISELPDSYRPSIRLRLYGRTLDQAFYSSLFGLSRNSSTIEILGELSHDEYLAALEATDIVLVSSRDDTLPLVSIDALSSGRVLLVTQATGTADYLLNGVTGYVAPSPAPTDIAKSLREIIDDRDRLNAIALNGQRLFAERFSVASFIQRLCAAADISISPEH